MGTLQLNSCGLATSTSSSHSATRSFSKHQHFPPRNLFPCTGRKNSSIHRRSSKLLTKAIGTVPERRESDESITDSSEKEQEDEQGPPLVNFAFVNSVLLPDGMPDIHYRTACGGQKLRNIMLDNQIELYGPYGRPLLNCAGGGTCGTCLVEIVEGKELLNPRTDKEKEKLNKKPKNWRLACQTNVGTEESRGLLVVQQLPEWKAHEWKYERVKE